MNRHVKNPSGRHPLVVTEVDAQEFSLIARQTPMRDGFGVMTGSEKAGLAALGDRWLLLYLDPEIMRPVAGPVPDKKAIKHAIIYAAVNCDVVDGRHRLQLAVEEGRPSILAWVGLLENDYQHWYETDEWPSIPIVEPQKL